ncbi:class I SAM-dependent methyltransferase [Brachybacterium sp. MASK1Z-5]|uniref:Class I SAM-dependent methyltransferase n=1 Tax=Brachybacterium halotolerans TaxID=2795215 RepID=A0ABS1BA30_9MICO|nr:class I SAM-dependent methyltransferase [Brachybacterium halotolerans]MBK0331506.1 class I SAM-dependent methyltransferase [Brachybacterium halotolerans]
MNPWTDRGDAYARSFGSLCAGTVDHLLDATGSGTLLDAGCGTGTLAVQAESRGRSVTAIDSEASMVDLARSRLHGPVLRASLPHLPFPDASFDAVAANFVINHVGRPAESVAELARVTRPSGPVAMTIWPAPEPDGWQGFIGEIFEAAGVVPIPRQDLDPTLDFERTSAGLEGLARGAGLEVVSASDLRWTWSVRPDDLWAGIEGGIAGAGATYSAQSDRVRRAASGIFENRCGKAVDHVGHLSFPVRAACVVAERR